MSDDDSISYPEYREQVKSIAERVLRAEEEEGEHRSDLIWQEIDSHQWIIYYGYNLDVLELADSEPHEWKHLVADDDGYREVLQAMAYKALEGDVYEEIREQE